MRTVNLQTAFIAASGVAELEERRAWELAAPGMSDVLWEEHRALLERHQEFRDFEFERHDRQGHSYWVSISGTPVFDDDGVFCGYRGGPASATRTSCASPPLRSSRKRA